MNGDFLKQILFWTFVPRAATQFIQRQMYWLLWKRAPTAREPAHRRHFVRIYALFVLAYLLYTVYQFELDLPENYYQMLQVPRQFEARDLKNSFRSLSLQYHPDKVPPGADAGAHERRYIAIRAAYEVLKEPASRLIYDFFGDEVVKCTYCKLDKDYLFEALPGFVGFYAGSFLVLLIFSVLGRVDFGKYWRFLGLALLATLEGLMLLQGKDPLSLLFPWRTPHERIAFLRQFVVIVFIALSQLGPLLFPQDLRTPKQLVEELEQLSSMQLKESTITFASVFEPFAADPKASGLLQRKMEKLALDLRFLEGDAAYSEEYRRAHQRALGAGRTGPPSRGGPNALVHTRLPLPPCFLCYPRRSPAPSMATGHQTQPAPSPGQQEGSQGVPFNRDQVSSFLHTRWLKSASEVDFVQHLVYADLGDSWDAPLPAVEWREERAPMADLPLASGRSMLRQLGVPSPGTAVASAAAAP